MFFCANGPLYVHAAWPKSNNQKTQIAFDCLRLFTTRIDLLRKSCVFIYFTTLQAQLASHAPQTAGQTNYLFKYVYDCLEPNFVCLLKKQPMNDRTFMSWAPLVSSSSAQFTNDSSSARNCLFTFVYDCLQPNLGCLLIN